MSTTLKIQFKFDEDNKISIDFNVKTDIESMLKIYLNKTNSKETLNKKDILFLYGDKVLNSKPFINMNIENIFNRQKRTITVKDKGKIIGGATNIAFSD